MLRAEMMAALVKRIAAEQITSADRIAAAAREALSTLPDPRVDEARVRQAAEALRETARQWAALTPGQEMVIDWPEKKPRRRA